MVPSLVLYTVLYTVARADPIHFSFSISVGYCSLIRFHLYSCTWAWIHLFMRKP